MDFNTATPPNSSPPDNMSIEREDVPMVEGSNPSNRTSVSLILKNVYFSELDMKSNSKN